MTTNNTVLWIKLEAAEGILKDLVPDYEASQIKKIWGLMQQDGEAEEGEQDQEQKQKPKQKRLKKKTLK
jgi:hypothetical protein